MVDPFGEKVRENYRLQGEVRAVEKLFALIQEVTTDNRTGHLVYLEDLVAVLGEHGTVAEMRNDGRLVLHKLNGKGL